MPLSPRAGIAIGPILFVIAILGVLAATMTSNMASFGSAGSADRVTADISTQANLIRNKILECNLTYNDTTTNGDGYPASGLSGTLVETATCSGDLAAGYSSGNLWTGARNTLLPAPTSGFKPWTYINAGDVGGRCFWTVPTGGKSSSGVVAGLTRAATKFTSQEINYSPASATQKFVVFVTRPTGNVSSYCSAD